MSDREAAIRRRLAGQERRDNGPWAKGMGLATIEETKRLTEDARWLLAGLAAAREREAKLREALRDIRGELEAALARGEGLADRRRKDKGAIPRAVGRWVVRKADAALADGEGEA